MIFALPGKGKTLFALELAWRCSQGLDFMDWKFNNMIKPPPVLYVEGEMSATQVQDRVSSMVERDRGLKDFDLDNFYIAVLKEQPNESYQKLKTPEGRLNVQNSADEIYKKTGKKPIIFLDNVRFLMGNFNEKEGQDWIDFVLWLATLRAKGYSTYFLHHAVNTGEKASGSGYQDSNLDVNIKLSQPDENSATDHSSDHFTQIQFEFKKMRENVIGQMTPFIMVVDRNKGSWSKFPVLNKTERKIKSMLDSGKSAKDIINPEKEGMSKANVHKTINKLKGENDGVDKKTSNREAKEVC
jgi:RecA-family ATPase